MVLKGECKTTAMGIMPHTEINRAIKLALSLDIPFWPQVPKVNFYEDMYVQVTENFPGITIDEAKERINFHEENFYQDLINYVENSEIDEYFKLSPKFSAVYQNFLQQDLAKFDAIRGQSIGPISFGMKITDENRKPIIYNDEVKGFIYEFIARKINIQYRELLQKNSNAFVWIDEPGLEIIFGSFTGYSGETAQQDFAKFLESINGPKGVHLCGNPDWSFLLNQQLDILSIDAFGCGKIFSKYSSEVNDFLNRGGIISWGIVPTLTEELTKETLNNLIQTIESFWDFLASKSIKKEQIVNQAWFAPARCCLINQDGVDTVENAFRMLQEISYHFKEKYKII